VIPCCKPYACESTLRNGMNFNPRESSPAFLQSVRSSYVSLICHTASMVMSHKLAVTVSDIGCLGGLPSSLLTVRVGVDLKHGETIKVPHAAFTEARTSDADQPNRSWGKIEETQADRLEAQESLERMRASTRYMQRWLSEHAVGHVNR
jgi:hypothetical protein